MKKCPCCGQPIIPGRICAACLKPIKRSHRFRFVGCFVIHIDCEHPESKDAVEPAAEEMVLTETNS